MPPNQRVLYYDPSTQKVKASDSSTIPDGPQFQCLEIPPLCDTITVYLDYSKKADNHPGDTAPGASRSRLIAEEPVKFALSRSRRSVRDSDLVATISLKKQQSNSWFQRHLPLPQNYFDKIVIGPFDKRNTAAKEGSTSVESKAEPPGDKSNPPEDGSGLSSIGDTGKAVECQSTTNHATSVKRD
ncbi:hypothetical protein F4860DRAFT_507713 [Xylaria cubensis]|nr:hypothetical protein F4860DRAFT_507713 [Xylaria cubensis]